MQGGVPTVVEGAGLCTSDPVDDVVPYPDQALYLALRGAGQAAVMQAIWIYDHPVDLDGVARFHRNLYGGLLARRVERSALPFGRHRWVAAPFGEDNFQVADRPRPRSELFDWADEQVELPLDPEWGPAWRLAVQPFTDGSTIISLVISHCIADGAGSVMACVQAINGNVRDLGYRPPKSRPRFRAVRQDLRQLVRDLPEIGRTIVHSVGVAVRRRRDFARPVPAATAITSDDGAVHVPSVTVFIDTAAWDGRAERLGGNSFSLAAGFAGKLAHNLNRTRASDGAVTLMIPVSEREDPEDTGGNLVAIGSVTFDPTQVTTDLTGARTAIRDALRKAREEPDEMIQMLPLIPFVPKRGIAKMADVAFGFSTDLPVSCSNLGEIPSDLLKLDGTPAQYFSCRGMDRKVTRQTLERRGGILTALTVRGAGKVAITVISYQLCQRNTQSGLREVIAKTLEDFSLTGDMA